MRQFRYMAGLFDRIKEIPGDVVECGLGEGHTFAMLAYLVGSERTQPARILWGFDSFEGWPEPTDYDRSPREPKRGEWYVSQDQVKQRLEGSLVNTEFPDLEIRIVPGFFGETLAAFPDRAIAFLHLDCDLYTSYRDGLIHLFPKVSPGGGVLFDEYQEFPQEYVGVEKWPGATKAINDYLAGSGLPLQYHEETKKYYVIKTP
jgi:hypothetical protein